MPAKSNTKWAEGHMEAMVLSLQYHTHWFWHASTYIYTALGWNWRVPTNVGGPVRRHFWKLVINWLRMHLPTCSKVFYKPLKTLRIDMWIPIPIQRYKNTSGKDSDLIVEKTMNNGKTIFMVLLCSIQSFHLKISIQSFLYCSLVFYLEKAALSIKVMALHKKF